MVRPHGHVGTRFSGPWDVVGCSIGIASRNLRSFRYVVGRIILSAPPTQAEDT